MKSGIASYLHFLIIMVVIQGGQFILLGSSPVGHIQADFEKLAAEARSAVLIDSIIIHLHGLELTFLYLFPSFLSSVCREQRCKAYPYI